MEHYRYIIIGGGMAGHAAVQAILEQDSQGTILVIGDEPFAPYRRPPLSKALWKGERLEDIWLSVGAEDDRLNFHLGSRVQNINVDEKRVEVADGATWQFEKLLLVTGGRPRVLAGSRKRVFYPGHLAEHVRLHRHLGDEPRDVLVVGGGFIGSEMAAVLSERGHHVKWLMMEDRPFARMFPESLGNHLASAYREHGVEIHTRVGVTRFDEAAAGVLAVMDNGRSIAAELAVVGAGFEPNVELAQKAGLMSAGPGVPVNEFGQTVHPDIYAAGDVAVSAVDLHLMMHEDHALSQGRAVGTNMAGGRAAYTERPFFYSDLYHWGYEAVGDLNTRHRVVEDWVVPGDEGVLYYLEGDRLVGVLNWNVWDAVPTARALLEMPRRWTDEELRGQIRNG